VKYWFLAQRRAYAFAILFQTTWWPVSHPAAPRIAMRLRRAASPVGPDRREDGVRHAGEVHESLGRERGWSRPADRDRGRSSACV